MFPISLRGCACLALLLLAVPAMAQPSRIPATLPAVLDWTAAHHPALQRMTHELQARSALVDAAGFGPPLTLDAEVENPAGTGEFAGGDRLETTLSLGGVLEWGGRPMLRRVEALSRTDVLRIELDQQRRDVLADAALRFIDLARAQADLDLLEQALKAAEQTADASRERQQAGAASAADTQRATLELSAARLRIRQARTRRQGAERALAIATGAPNAAVAAPRVDWSTLPPVPSRGHLLRWAQQAPAVNLATADQSLAQARLRLAASRARSDLSWSVGVRDDRDSGDQALVFGLGLSLGSSRRSQPERQAAEAQVEASHWARQSAGLEAQALVTAAWAELDALYEAFAVIRDDLEAQSAEVLQAMRDGYRQGRYSLLELTTAQQDLLTWRQRRLAVATEYHQTRIELERLLGRSLGENASQ